MVSFDFLALRVVGITTRWDESDRVVRYSSMRRSPMPKPIPLPTLLSDHTIWNAPFQSEAYLFPPVTRTNKVFSAGTDSQGAGAIVVSSVYRGSDGEGTAKRTLEKLESKSTATKLALHNAQKNGCRQLRTT